MYVPTALNTLSKVTESLQLHYIKENFQASRWYPTPYVKYVMRPLIHHYSNGGKTASASYSGYLVYYRKSDLKQYLSPKHDIEIN